MVSERQLGNHNDSPLQYLQFPTMTITQNIVKKLKIKITSKKVESCEFGQQLFTNVESGHSISVNGSKNSVMNKSDQFVVHSYDDPKLYSADNLKVKLSMRNSHKRGSPGVVDCQKDKRQKLDRTVKQQCGNILRTLMTHPAGWVFNKPVDPVALDIPDYFSIVTQPMDLGTIKTKLGDNMYFSAAEFVADVRLTFSNAMLYNPPINKVHGMAKELDNLFTRRWKTVEAKLNRDMKNVEQGCIATNTLGKLSPARISLLPKNSMPSKEKKKLRKELLEASRGKMTEKLHSFLQKFGLICQKEEEIEMGMDALDDETLSALKRLVKASLDARASKDVPYKMSENSKGLLLGKVILKGSDSGSRSTCGSANTKSSLCVVASKCGSCDNVTCQCGLRNDYALASSSDLSSERALGHDRGASKTDRQVKTILKSCSSKSDPNSDGAVSTLDEENVCSTARPSSPATTSASGEGWTPLFDDLQLSPKKALRAAMLKSRFADTILKAKQKTLLDQGDTADPVKMQQEKERLERQQQEEAARIEAQIKAAEAASRLRAEAQLKMQREREREAARIALQKMEKTVEIDENVEILKDLEILRWSSEDGFEAAVGMMESGQYGNPLERLGLFIKQDYIMGDEEEDDDMEMKIPSGGGDGEEGEICS